MVYGMKCEVSGKQKIADRKPYTLNHIPQL